MAMPRVDRRRDDAVRVPRQKRSGESRQCRHADHVEATGKRNATRGGEADPDAGE